MRRRAAVALLGIALAVAVVAWAVPTFGGRAFVEVRVRVVPIVGEPATGRSIVLPDGSNADSARLRVVIEIQNHYPLPVLIDFRGPAFRATVIDRDSSGGPPVWQASADDAAIEQGDESPDGGDSPRVTLVAPGTTLLPISDPGMTVDVAAGTVFEPGIYSLQVSAYGIAASPQLLSIVATAAG